MASHKTYSVFVGHLSKDINKKTTEIYIKVNELTAFNVLIINLGEITAYYTLEADLRELFSGCGDVVDIFIVENTKTVSYNYAFVRYSKFLMAQKAVSELNNWTLKGVPLVVSLAKDTVKKRADEKMDSSYSLVKDQIQKSKRENPEITGLKSSNHINSIMYLNRLKENCTALNLDLAQNSSTKGGQDGINVHMLIEHIKKTDCTKAPTVWGDLTQRNNSLQSIKERLFERAKTKTPNDSVGQKKVQEFLSSLNTVISTVNSFLRENMETIDDSVNDSPKVLTDGENHKVHKMLAGMTGLRSEKDTDLGSDLLTVDPSVVHVIQSNPTTKTIPSGLLRSDSHTSSTSEEDYNDFISDSGIECDGDMLASPVLSKIKDRSSKTLSCFNGDLSSCHTCESQDSSSLVRSSSPRDGILSLHSSSLELVRSLISRTSSSCMSDDDHLLLNGMLTKPMKRDINGRVQPSSRESSWLSRGFKISHCLGRGRGGNQMTCPVKPLASLGRGYAMSAILDSAKKE